jgi:hypothetical protein
MAGASKTVSEYPVTASPVVLTTLPTIDARVSSGSSPSVGLESQRAMGVCVTPAIGSHLSVVHGSPSSTTGAVPAAQAPALLHVSVPLHALPSEQLVPGDGVWMIPAAGSQASTVQGFPSSATGGTPLVQAPAPLQVSCPLQGLPSEQLAPEGFGGLAQIPVFESHVPMSWQES